MKYRYGDLNSNYNEEAKAMTLTTHPASKETPLLLEGIFPCASWLEKQGSGKRKGTEGEWGKD